jgi:hypothetical protein
MLSRAEETSGKTRKISDKTVETSDRIRVILEGTVKTFEMTPRTYGLTGRNWQTQTNQVTKGKSGRRKNACAVISATATRIGRI